MSQFVYYYELCHSADMSFSFLAALAEKIATDPRVEWLKACMTIAHHMKHRDILWTAVFLATVTDAALESTQSEHQRACRAVEQLMAKFSELVMSLIDSEDAER